MLKKIRITWEDAFLFVLWAFLLFIVSALCAYCFSNKPTICYTLGGSSDGGLENLLNQIKKK